MAVRRSVSLTIAVVFLLVGVALARAPSSLQENEVSLAADSLPVSDVQSVLHLPSDSGDNDESHHSYTDPHAQERDHPTLESAETMKVGSSPVRVVRIHDFRPVNRRFPVRSRFPFRHCRHVHHRHDQPLRPMRRNADISHGNDMISSAGEDEWIRDLDLTRWVRLPFRHRHRYHHHHHHHDDDEGGLSKFVLDHRHGFNREGFEQQWHHNDGQGNEEVEDEEKRGGEERKKLENEEKAEGGFARRIRKFLGHF